MKVLKFGGSSVAGATMMSRVLDIVERASVEDRVIIVCSAISGCTDRLISIGKLSDRRDSVEELRQEHFRICERLFSGAELKGIREELELLFNEIISAPSSCIQTYGELLSTRIIAGKLACEGKSVRWLDSRDLVRISKSALDRETTYSNIRKALDPDTRIFVVPGFIARNENGEAADLGRGGSDYSAAIFAAASDAEEVQIWTDVHGIMSANPKDWPSAHTVSNLSYDAAFALASHGAKVLYPPTILPAREKGIPISVRNSFDPFNPGTVISAGDSSVEKWIAVTSSREGEVSTITLVGENIKSEEAVRSRIQRCLAGSGISVCGEIRRDGPLCFCIPVRRNIEGPAIIVVHEEFLSKRYLSEINVYIAGYGAVGRALVKLIGESAGRIEERQRRRIRICGVADSNRSFTVPEGIAPEDVPGALEKASAGEGDFIDAVLKSAGNGILVDCTDSCDIYKRFPELFRRGIGVVTSNRRSLAVPYAEYVAMKREALENGVAFRYDTTVGTALPVLESISDSANCADEITSIEAVVSCTMNQIISSYSHDGSPSFFSLLRKAQEEGLTEPDPRFDLGGGDVLRKLLILAREAGVPLEGRDVVVCPMLGQDYFDCSLEEFYIRLEKAEPELRERERNLSEKGLRQRFVASLEITPDAFRAGIRMESVGEDSPFYRLNGTENVIRIERRNTAPLVIRGAGEGAFQAASGVLNDILK